MEFLKEMTGSEYVGFSNATWVVFIFLFTRFFFQYCCWTVDGSVARLLWKSSYILPQWLKTSENVFMFFLVGNTEVYFSLLMFLQFSVREGNRWQELRHWLLPEGEKGENPRSQNYSPSSPQLCVWFSTPVPAVFSRQRRYDRSPGFLLPGETTTSRVTWLL